MTQGGGEADSPSKRGRYGTTGGKGFRTRKRNVVKGTSVNSEGAPTSGWSVWHTVRQVRLKKYRGKLPYKIPIFNFFYGFYDIDNDPPEWSQITGLLNVLAIVTALLLALVITFYSTVDYEEIQSADLRFSWGGDHPDHPGFRSTVQLFRQNARYLEFASPSCFGAANSAACIDDWEKGGNNVTGWLPAFNTTAADFNGAVAGSAMYPWCQYPCYADRPYAGSDQATSFASGHYAQAWALRRVFGISGDAAKEALSSGEHLVQNDVCREDDTEQGNICLHVQSPTEEFANFSTWCAGVLSSALLLSVLVLGAGSTNPFATDQDNAGYSYQYRIIVRSYLYWVRFVNLGIIIGTILGAVLFIQSLKAMVYVKYTDDYLVENGYFPSFGFYFSSDSPYAFVNTATIWLFYFPIAVGAIILSVSVAVLNSFPAHSATDLNNVRSMGMAARRKAHADDLADFLQFVGQLPRFEAPSLEEGGMNPSGPRLGCFGKQKGFRTDMGVTMKGAGGLSSFEAETVADALIDAGIYDVRSLCRLILHDQLGGLGEMPPLYGMSALTPGAVLCIMLGIRRFAAINATDQPGAAEDEEAVVNAVRIPKDYMTYLTASYSAEGVTTIPTLPDIWNPDYNKGGWKQKSAGGDYIVYEKRCRLIDDKASNSEQEDYLRSTAKLKIDAVVLWWMEKLKTMRVVHEGKYYLARPRIPDPELFPEEHLAVEKWLIDERNAYKDARLAFIEQGSLFKRTRTVARKGEQFYADSVEFKFAAKGNGPQNPYQAKTMILNNSPFLPDMVDKPPREFSM